MKQILRSIAVLAVLAVLASPLFAQTSFYDDFSAPALDPSWTVFTYTGPRVFGFPPPANSYSLTDRPGYLRYTLTPMTHEWGFINGYQTSAPGETSCCAADPALEISRPFTGEHWLFETKLETFMPFSNGRGFRAQVSFGEGGPGTLLVALWRQRDVNQNWHGVLSFLQIGTHVADMIRAAGDSIVSLPVFDGPSATAWFRLQRDGSVLSASFSADGALWTTLMTKDFGTLLDGKPQRLAIIGGSWFNSAGSYADWDYVSLQPTGVAPAIACPVPVVVDNDHGACGARVSFNVTATGTPEPVVTCSIASGSLFPVGTTSYTCTATNSLGQASCGGQVTVRDAEAPALGAVTASPNVLGPPNHKMRDVTVNYGASDNCGLAQCSLTVTSNEPANGLGDGDQSPDWEIVDARHVRLRAGRSGTGSGRRYTITAICVDGTGNASSRTTTVSVQH
jgi:hypothetical protein